MIWIDREIFERKPRGGIAKFWNQITPALSTQLAGVTVCDYAPDADVFLPTYYATPPDGMRSVLVVYDLIQEMFPAIYGHAPEDMTRMKIAISRAARVVSISKATQENLLSILGVESDVVYCPYAPAKMLPVELPENYFVLFGAGAPYKNTAAIYRVWEHRADKGDWLVVIGRRQNAADLYIQNKDDPNVLYLDNVAEGELAYIYRNAVALLYPSLEEGFGYPPLEAMSYRCPVIAGPAASIKEVCGDGGALYAIAPEDLLWAMEEVKNPPRREAMLSAGGSRLITPRSSASKLVGIIEEAMREDFSPFGQRA